MNPASPQARLAAETFRTYFRPEVADAAVRLLVIVLDTARVEGEVIATERASAKVRGMVEART